MAYSKGHQVSGSMHTPQGHTTIPWNPEDPQEPMENQTDCAYALVCHLDTCGGATSFPATGTTLMRMDL